MSPGGGPRLLLRRLREIMAEQTSAQMRLDKLVTTIASNMVAEVCSIYLRRAGKVLELFATEGLAREAVHKTRMKEGEGLVAEAELLAAGREADDRAGHEDAGGGDREGLAPLTLQHQGRGPDGGDAIVHLADRPDEIEEPAGQGHQHQGQLPLEQQP